MKIKKHLSFIAILVCSISNLNTHAQCDPGTHITNGINRCYDDGYVYIDVTGGEYNSTWFWGYQNTSQVEGNLIKFHSTTTNLNGEVVQLLTDSYDLGGVFPPLAPYNGNFNGPGLIIPDTPISRTIEMYSSPDIRIEALGTNYLKISWPAPLTGWKLQENSSLKSTNWMQMLNSSIHTESNQYTVISATSNNFFRLLYTE